MSESTNLQELNHLCATIDEEDRLIKEEANRLKEKQKELEKKKAKLIQIFEENEMTSYKHGSCNFISVVRTSVPTPKGDDQIKFFNWAWDVKGPDFVRGMFKMNSQTLQAFYKAEEETAIEEKNLDFGIPGIGAKTSVTTLSIRRK